MDLLTLIPSVLFFCFLLWWLQKALDKRQGLPPGPFRFPLIGSVVQILIHDRKFPFIGLEKLAAYYGNVFYIQIGIVKMVVANEYEAINEVYHSDDFIGRINDKWILDKSYGLDLGFFASSPNVWKETRRICTRNLKEFGFGIKNKMEYFIQEELEELCSHIRSEIEQTNGIIQVSNLFSTPAINIVWSMVSGSRFKYGDPKLDELLNLTHDFFKSATFGAGLLTAYPFLAEYAPKLAGFDKLKLINLRMQKYMENIIAEIRTEKKYQTNPTNFIEVYLQKIDSREINDTIDDTIYSDKSLVSILYDFFIAATETADTILTYGILCLILNPNVQEKIHREIDIVIGKRKPELADKEKMVFTQATILEIFRISAFGPIVPRKSIRDTTLGNYRIPKDTVVLLNLYNLAMNKKVWGDPEVFRPERFLDSSGNIVNEDQIFSFGGGESVGKSTIFIILTGVLQRFRFFVNLTKKTPSLSLNDRVLGMTLSAKPFSAIVGLRQ